MKVGVDVDEVRLTMDEGMVMRSEVKAHPVLGKHRIITQRQGTVFRLSVPETAAIETLWGSKGGAGFVPSAIEGALRLRVHYRRERSRKLTEDKKRDFLRHHGSLFCEVCEVAAGRRSPAAMGEPFIEVHHRLPLSAARRPVETTLDDLILVCANCHRLIHSTSDYERNTTNLREFFSKTS